MTNPTQEQKMEALRKKARMLGIQYNANIGYDKLKEKVDAKLAEQPDVDPVVSNPEELNEGARRAAKVKEANKLERVIITCFNPNKKDWPGEIFSVGNTYIGQVKKYVPFDTPWHVPAIILKRIEKAEFQTFETYNVGNGKKSKRGKLVKAYGVERLDPLSMEELEELAKIQVATGRTQD